MLKQRLLIAAAVCLVSSSLYGLGFSRTQDFRAATPEELAMTSVPGAEGASAAVLDWVRIDEDRQSASAEYLRIKIFTEEGTKHGDVEILYAPGHPMRGRVDGISARTIRPDGSIVPFDGKVYDKVVYKEGRRALRAKTFTLKEVQPGSIIEYRFIRRWSEHLLFNTVWSVQQEIPVARAKFRLVPYLDQDFRSYFTYSALPAGSEPVRKEGGFELELRNLPPFRRESFAPPEVEIAPRVNFFYTRSSVRTEKFWDIQAGDFAKTIERFIGKAPAVAERANAIAGEATDRAQVVRKLYAHAQKLRNLSHVADATEQELKESRNAAEVLKKGAGFSTEITRTFVALARAAGLEASVLRVAPRDQSFFSRHVPDADQMSDEIAVVKIGGTSFYLDPGTPHAPFGTVSWEKTAVPAIFIGPGSSSSWGETPLATADAASTRRTADLRLDGESATGTITVTFSGQEALVRRLRTFTDDEVARQKALEDEVRAWLPEGSTLKVTRLAGADTPDEALEASFEVAMPNLVSRAGSRYLVPLSVFASTAPNPFAPATRTHPIYFRYQRSENDEVKLTLPEGLAVVTAPAPKNLDAGALAYTNETAHDGSTVTFRRTATIATLMLDPKYYNAMRKFFTAVNAADQEPVIITATAGGTE